MSDISSRLENIAVEAARGVAEEATSGVSEGLIVRVHRQIEQLLREQGDQREIEAYTTKFLEELGKAANPAVAESFRREFELIRGKEQAIVSNPAGAEDGSQTNQKKTVPSSSKIAIPVWNRPSTSPKVNYKAVAERKLKAREERLRGGVWGTVVSSPAAPSNSAAAKPAEPKTDPHKPDATKAAGGQGDAKAQPAGHGDAKHKPDDKPAAAKKH